MQLVYEITTLSPIYSWYCKAGRVLLTIHAGAFWLIWFINQRALPNHALSVVHCCHHWCNHHIGGSRGACQAHTPPMGPNSFIFTYIFAKKHPHQRSTSPSWVHAPLREILDPPLHHQCWHHHWCCLCKSLQATGLDIHTHAPMSLIYAHQIVSDSDL